MFKNGLDAEVEALRENTERELFLELGGEDMVDGERVGLPVTSTVAQGRRLSRLTARRARSERGRYDGLSRWFVTRL